MEQQAGNSGIEFAVYCEKSPQSKEMVSGGNPRVFNHVDAQRGNSISLDPITGAVTLQPGCYHISACSIVTSFTEQDIDGRVTTVPRPNGSYAMLRYWTDTTGRTDSICLGTVSTANMDPSLIETYLEVKDAPVAIQVVHQAGDLSETWPRLFLQVYVDDSADHVFARISIRKL